MATIPDVEGTAPFIVEGETFETWYRVVGDLTTRTRPPLIALHGGPGLSHDYLLPLIDLAASASIPVVLYDQIGGGRSTHLREKPPSFWSIDLFVDELANLITHLRISEEFDIIGHSWGGMLAMEYQIRRGPVGLRRLILTNSLASIPMWYESTAQLLSAFPKECRKGWLRGGMT